ncbi:MAG: S8 family serine peptidase [Notoacmeibacter sp.]|nr:S8 family serine peptidase [Notoacmeibacter sp.]MCC0033540.1 S8 family serine peptidase [Brucellaceae bacterium]
MAPVPPLPSWAGLEVVEAPALTAGDRVASRVRFIIRLDVQRLQAEGLDPQTVSVEALAQRFGLQVFQIRSIQRRHLPGFIADLTPAQAAALAADPVIARISPDTVLRPAGDVPLSWGLDRLDQPALPLDGHYERQPSRGGARVYLLDSGIDAGHPDLEGRTSFGAAFVPVVPEAFSVVCHLHGTAMASLIAGRTMGVVSDVQVIDVTILPCVPGEAGQASALVEAMHWLFDRELTMEPRKPAVVNLSLTGPKSADVNDWIAKAADYGIAIVAAAGNEAGDACDYSPASAPQAITVAARGPDDERAAFSNGGPCIDIDAPGVLVTAASAANHDRPYASNGTSAAAAHVSGVLARNLVEVEAGLPSALVLTNAAMITPAGTPKDKGALLVQADSPLRFDCRVAVDVASLNIRTGPGTGDDVVAQAAPGARIEVKTIEGDWAEVRLASGATGWAAIRHKGAILLETASGDRPCN